MKENQVQEVLKEAGGRSDHGPESTAAQIAQGGTTPAPTFGEAEGKPATTEELKNAADEEQAEGRPFGPQVFGQQAAAPSQVAGEAQKAAKEEKEESEGPKSLDQMTHAELDDFNDSEGPFDGYPKNGDKGEKVNFLLGQQD